MTEEQVDRLQEIEQEATRLGLGIDFRVTQVDCLFQELKGAP